MRDASSKALRREEHFPRSLLTHYRGQRFGDAETLVESEQREIGTESALGGRHSKVTRKCEPKTSADRRALRRRYERFIEAKDSQGLAVEFTNVGSYSCAAVLGNFWARTREIGARAEVFTFGANHRHPTRRVAIEILKFVREQ